MKVSQTKTKVFKYITNRATEPNASSFTRNKALTPLKSVSLLALLGLGLWRRLWERWV